MKSRMIPNCAAATFCSTEGLPGPAIPEWRMGTGNLKCVHHTAPYLRALLPMLPLGCTGLFVLSIVHPLPAVSIRNSTYAIGTDVTQRQSGFAIPLTASARGVLRSTRCQST